MLCDIAKLIILLILVFCPRYADQAVSGNQATTKSFHLLLDLMTFFDQYHARDMDRALTVSTGKKKFADNSCLCQSMLFGKNN